MTASLATNKFGNLTYWTNTDPQSLPTESSTTTGSLKNAFDAVSNTRMIQSFLWANATARNAQTGMVEGDIGDQADTDTQYRYNGSGWIQTSSIVGPIIPGTPTSTGGTASVSAGGEVTFGGSTTDLLVPGVFFTTGITEIDIEVLTSSGGANCTWVLVTAAGASLTTGYTTNMFQLTTGAAAVNSVASITTAWQNLRINTTTGGHGNFRVARAASTTRKSMMGGNIDGAVLDFGGGWNTSALAHTGVKFSFGGATVTGVVRFRLVGNQS